MLPRKISSYQTTTAKDPSSALSYSTSLSSKKKEPMPPAPAAVQNRTSRPFNTYKQQAFNQFTPIQPLSSQQNTTSDMSQQQQ